LAEETGTSGGGGELRQFDMRLISYGASGVLKLYFGGNESPLVTYSGDLSIAGVSGFIRVGGRGISLSFGGHTSQIIVHTADTRGMHLVTLEPNAAGDHTDWTGAYTDIDEEEINDADDIYTANPGDDWSHGMSDIPSGNWKVKGVKTSARGVDTTEVLAVKHGIRTNSTDYLKGKKSYLSSYQTFEEFWETNPDTTNPFTGAEVDALQQVMSTVTATTTTSTTTTSTTTTT
jgi:hypothetical protein